MLPPTPSVNPGAAAFGVKDLGVCSEEWKRAAASGAFSEHRPLDGGKDAAVCLLDEQPKEMTLLLDLRRSTDNLLSAIEDRIRQAVRREEEAVVLCQDSRRKQEDWEKERMRMCADLDAERERLQREREALDAEKARMQHSSALRSDVLSLNLGGQKVVQRRRSTLCAVEDSFLAARFSGRWEHDLDRDEEGRFFINYSPELFLPLLDYLSVKETEDPCRQVPFPQGPENQRQQFQAMLKYFGMLPGASVLDSLYLDYSAVGSSDHGLAFEVVPKSCAVCLIAIETCAGLPVTTAASATVYICQGTLLRRLRQRDEWRQVGTGTLRPGQQSRIEFNEPVLLQAKTTHCIYLATNNPSGIAIGAEARGSEICAENDDLQVHAGRTSGSMSHFSGFEGFIYWFAFNGKLEYTIVDGI